MIAQVYPKKRFKSALECWIIEKRSDSGYSHDVFAHIFAHEDGTRFYVSFISPEGESVVISEADQSEIYLQVTESERLTLPDYLAKLAKLQGEASSVSEPERLGLGSVFRPSKKLV